MIPPIKNVADKIGMAKPEIALIEAIDTSAIS
jgi:hypothetical protein